MNLLISPIKLSSQQRNEKEESMRDFDESKGVIIPCTPEYSMKDRSDSMLVTAGVEDATASGSLMSLELSFFVSLLLLLLLVPPIDGIGMLVVFTDVSDGESNNNDIGDGKLGCG
jgi:hypothetical protein